MSSKMFTKSPLNQQQNVQSVRLFDTSDVKLRDGIKIPVKIDKNPEKTDRNYEIENRHSCSHTRRTITVNVVNWYGAIWRCCHHVTCRKWYIAYRIVAILMTLSDPQGHPPNAGLLKCDFSYSCPAVDKILIFNWHGMSCDPSMRAEPLV